MKYSQNVIPQPSCGSLPSLSPQRGFGWGREGEEQNKHQKNPKHQRPVLCVCVQSPTGPCLPEAGSPSCWNQSFGKQDCPRCPGLSHLFMDPFSSWGGKKRRPRDSEVTRQYPTEKGILQQLGFPLMVFFRVRLWGVSKIPFKISIPLPVVLNIIPVRNTRFCWPWNLFIFYSWRGRQKSTKSHGNVLWGSP